jgi:hypothetical protein
MNECLISLVKCNLTPIFSKKLFAPFTVKAISNQENFQRTENFPKISLLKVENFQLQKFFSDVKFVSAITFYKSFRPWKFFS